MPNGFHLKFAIQLKTFQLPDDLFAVSDLNNSEVIIRHYQSVQNRERNKIILNQNMINLVVDGYKTVIYPEHTVTVRGQELVLLTTGNILTSEVVAQNKHFTSLILYFSNDKLAQFLVKYEYLINSTPQNPKLSYFLTYPQDEYIRLYVHSLITLLRSGARMTAEFRQVKLEEILLYLLQSDPQKFLALRVASRDQVDMRVKKVVEVHIVRPITVGELAFLCNMSTSTFKRKFSQMYGTSPQKWLLSKRLQLAAELLKFPFESPSNVYQKVGYENHSSFSEAFRKFFDVTPSDYQSRHLLKIS